MPANGHHRQESEDRRSLRIGCALLPKKVSRYLTPNMLETATAKGIELFTIDSTQPLEEQGPFDAIIHKLPPNAAWTASLETYTQAHPDTKVIDPVDRIRNLQNRSTMLLPLGGEGLTIKPEAWDDAISDEEPHSVRVQAPTQVELPEGTSLEEATAKLAAAGLSPPLLAKPIWTDGREGSHGLAVLHDMASLGKLLEGQVCSELQLPLVVQEFVEHGGAMFKVYVLGALTVVTKRPSLGDSHLGEEAQARGVLPVPRISCRSKDRLVKNKLGYRISDNTAMIGSNGSSFLDLGTGACNGSGGNHDVSAAAAAGRGGSPHASASHAVGDGTGGATVRSSPSGNGLVVVNSYPDLPPEWFTAALASTMRERLGLQLFNFDLICPAEPSGSGSSANLASLAEGSALEGLGLEKSSLASAAASSSGNGQAPLRSTSGLERAEPLYYVIDINYFPGVDKIPGFERIFVDFLLAACRGPSAE